MTTCRRFTRDSDPTAIVEALRFDGAVFVDGLVDAATLGRLRVDLQAILADSAVGHHEYLGYRTRRTGRLFAKTRAADAVAVDPFVLRILEDLMGEIQLTAPSAIELFPGEVAGHWHHDDEFYPLSRPHPDVVCNVLVAIDDFTAANGATRVVPGSNRWDVPGDPTPNDPIDIAELAAGSAVIMTGATIHAAGANTTDKPRIGLALEYAAAWLRPQETLTLSVPPAIAVQAPKRLQELLGYGSTSTGLGHVGGAEPSVVFEEID